MKVILIIIIIFVIFGGLFYTIFFSDNWDLKTCVDECEHRGYETGECLWPREAEDLEGGVENIGSCFVAQSKHCGNKGQCNCYCKNKLVACTAEAKICPDGTAVGRVGPDCEFEACPVSKKCSSDSDCAVFGETGDCNCGCFNKQALPQGTGGECFCAAPESCKCVNKECEGIFEE